jgi:hypothetical protein
MGVAYGTRQSIGRVGIWGGVQGQQSFDHFLDLFFGGFAMANNRFLDL